MRQQTPTEKKVAWALHQVLAHNGHDALGVMLLPMVCVDGLKVTLEDLDPLPLEYKEDGYQKILMCLSQSFLGKFIYAQGGVIHMGGIVKEKALNNSEQPMIVR